MKTLSNATRSCTSDVQQTQMALGGSRRIFLHAWTVEFPTKGGARQTVTSRNAILEAQRSVLQALYFGTY